MPGLTSVLSNRTGTYPASGEITLKVYTPLDSTPADDCLTATKIMRFGCWKSPLIYSRAASSMIRICINKPHCLQQSILQHRHFISLRDKQIFHPQHEKDKVPKEFALIYESSSKNMIGISRIIYTMLGLLSAGMAFYYMLDTNEPWSQYVLGGLGALSLFAVAFINVISRYYLARIYLNEETMKFIGIYSGFAGKVEHVNYSLKNLKTVKLSTKSTQLHIKSNVQINGRTFHLRGHDFILPKYYNMHLRF